MFVVLLPEPGCEVGGLSRDERDGDPVFGQWHRRGDGKIQPEEEPEHGSPNGPHKQAREAVVR
jgi:hypothetical protein